VLVIDENDEWRRVLRRGLSGCGYSVSLATTWQQGRDLARRKGPSAIVLEVLSTGGHGLRALSELRGVCPDAALLVCTSYGSIAAAVAAMRAGARDFLLKPTTPAYVAAAIEDILQARYGEGLPARAIRAAPMPLDRLHWEHIQRVLMECDWNRTEAARHLGIHRQSLQRLLKKVPALRERDAWTVPTDTASRRARVTPMDARVTPASNENRPDAETSLVSQQAGQVAGPCTGCTPAPCSTVDRGVAEAERQWMTGSSGGRTGPVLPGCS
jgi:two-component system response regulator RegA